MIGVKKTIILLVVALIGATFTLLPALSVPVPGTMIVQMGSDKAIEKSILTLQKNIDNTFVVEYQSLAFLLTLHRTLNPAIWVGHGHEDGIETTQGLISWEIMASYIERTIGYDYLLACYSSNIFKQSTLTRNDVLTINGMIDAVYGALLVSFYKQPSFNIADKIFKYRQGLFEGRISLNPLYLDPINPILDPGNNEVYIPNSNNIPQSYEETMQKANQYIFLKMSGLELSYWVIMAIVVLIEVVFLMYCDIYAWSFLEVTMLRIYTSGQIALFATLIIGGAGGSSQEWLVGQLTNFFVNIGDIISSAIEEAPIYEIIAWGVLCGISTVAQILIYTLSSIAAPGIIAALRVTASIALVLAWIANVIFDALDEDMVVG